MKRAAICLTIALAQLVAAAATAQDASAPNSLREMIDATVKQVEIFESAESTVPAEPLVALRWANNARGSEDGTTLLYIFRGRPLATACLYPWDGKLIHDLESLSRFPLVGKKDAAAIWHPQTSSVTFTPIPDAPPPEATRAQRSRQLRSLAEQFQSAMLGWKADSTDREQLRLLPKPLYRYEPTGGPVLDGAVFAFVMGTDPESLLLIEAVQQGDKAVWEFAFARRTSGELEGRHRDRVVWHAPRYPAMKDPNQPRFSLGTPIPPALLVPSRATKE